MTLRWARIEPGLYRVIVGTDTWETVHGSLYQAGRYPWIVYKNGKQVASRPSLQEAKRRVEMFLR